MAATLTAFVTHVQMQCTAHHHSVQHSVVVLMYVCTYVRTYWGCLVVTCADFVCVPFHPFIPAVDAGLIGLSLSYTISLAALLQHGVRQAAEVESLVSSECSPITAMQVPRLGVYLSQVKMLLCCTG